MCMYADVGPCVDKDIGAAVCGLLYQLSQIVISRRTSVRPNAEMTRHEHYELYLHGLSVDNLSLLHAMEGVTIS